jgi:hypothetical protein
MVTSRRVHQGLGLKASIVLTLLEVPTPPPQPNVCDYDGRRPMHMAASEGRILVVSYLLGISADPNLTDRWGNTPLDESLKGSTLFHM